MRFWVGQDVIDLKRGRIIRVLAMNPDNTVITRFSEPDSASTHGAVIVRELTPAQIPEWAVFEKSPEWYPGAEF